MISFDEAWRAEQIASYSRKYQHNMRSKILTLLGGKCVRCGITDARVLQIDHTNGGGTKERKLTFGNNKNGYYLHILKVEGRGYQLLCANCNWIKRYEQHEEN